ncbi:MAG: hypothetical protein MR579_08670, partial [Bacteroidales bacterium]|nr:hypothetical protein [Bacteroidales bacterium]
YRMGTTQDKKAGKERAKALSLAQKSTLLYNTVIYAKTAGGKALPAPPFWGSIAGKRRSRA